MSPPLSIVRRFVERQENVVLVAALGIVLGLWTFLLTAGLILHGSTVALDEAVLRSLRQAAEPGRLIGPDWLSKAARDLTALGSAPVLLIVILIVAGHFALERRLPLVWLVLVTGYGGMILSSALKELFERARPAVVPHLDEVVSASFPSGHAMHAAVVYLTLGALAARFARGRAGRVYFLAVAIAITFLVGLSRVLVGVHYPTDVLGGWAAGLVWAIACMLVARALERRRILPRGA